ncbi:glycosyltransferase EpsJ [Psychrobacillus insolitus]|uniref:Glycosyltransferase EpsJ n=1 Tax=Psychrobacillus insolitus TaxID=1461 RepID=A0A2W7MN78_9BACI|nr:glycosyltransferase [Psychrobacillus insolitus]PZX05945.1 glycosyltransferase EpsJ [Psychrobacillus insolitus]
MDSNVQVSVIIPVYNAELYLSDCIQSIRNQTYKNIEVILINDGSTDNSGVICDEFASKDSRIKVSHQNNSGPSIARNRGIELAQGKYIQFVDSDDTIELMMTEILVESMNKDSQLVLSGYKATHINDDNNRILQNVTPGVHGILNNKEFLRDFGVLFEQSVIIQLWNKLYITEIIKKNNIQFVESLNIGEDLLFNLDYYKFCQNIHVINDSLYNYLIFNNTNSLISNYKKDFFGNQLLLFQKIREFLLRNDSYNKKNKDSVEVIFINSIVGCFNNLFHKNSNLTSQGIKEQIHKIILSKEVRDDIYYFKSGNIQKRLIGYLIKIKSINGIYYFIKAKNFLRYKIHPIFSLLKTFNYKD